MIVDIQILGFDPTIDKMSYFSNQAVYPGKIIPLNKIDEYICKDLNKEVNSTTYSFELNTIVSNGILCYYNGDFSESAFNKALEIDHPLRQITLKFIKEDYTFECWR